MVDSERVYFDFARLRAQYNHLKLQYITTELELAATFCKLALSTDDPERAAHSTANARKAYEAVMTALKDGGFRLAKRKKIAEKRKTVEQMLAKCEH